MMPHAPDSKQYTDAIHDILRSAGYRPVHWWVRWSGGWARVTPIAAAIASASGNEVRLAEVEFWRPDPPRLLFGKPITYCDDF